MSASPIDALKAASCALLLASAPAWAQTDAATGPPQMLLPGDVGSSTLAPIGNDPPPVLRGGPVTVGDLGNVDGPIAGTLNEAQGGLGQRAWEGMTRSVAETVLQHATAATPSATSRLLLRKLLLSEAPPPQGQGTGSFHRLRLRKLLEGGFVDDAADLALLIRSADEETQRAQADALLFAGRDDALCGETTAARLASAEPFWISLRAYCYGMAGDAAALDLTRAVMEQQGLADKVFLQLFDAVQAGEKPPIDPIAEPNALHFRLLVRLGVPLPENVVTALGMPAAMIAAASPITDANLRLAAAERAFRGGALPTQLLPEIVDRISFAPDELIGAAAMAPNDPVLLGLARLRAALRNERRAARRAELVVAAFRIGENEGLLPPVAALFADEAATITPGRDWDAWAPLMVRALLLAGRPGAAGRWHDLLDPSLPGEAAEAHFVRVILSLVVPNDIRSVNIDPTLRSLAMEALLPDARPTTVVRATLALGLTEAAGRDMPPEARSEIETLLAQDFGGEAPAPLVMERLERATLAGNTGEVALTVVDALGEASVRELRPDVIVRLVRALANVGLEDAARMLTFETLLTRPSDV
jgi:hypothetical protein